MKGFDVYGIGPTAAAATAWGAQFRTFYCDGNPSKDGTIAAVKSYAAAGMWVVTNFETTVARAAAGNSAGASDMQTALAEARAWGMPDGAAVYFSADEDIAVSDFPSILPYYQGAHEKAAGAVLVGCYGEQKLIAYLLDHGAIDIGGWRSASTSFPGGTSTTDVAIVQGGESTIGGHTVDVDTAIVDFFGQWKPGTLAPNGPAPSPASNPVNGQQDMPYRIQATGTDPQWLVDGGVVTGIPDGADVATGALGALPLYELDQAMVDAIIANSPPTLAEIQAAVTAGVEAASITVTSAVVASLAGATVVIPQTTLTVS